jgi:hypothetical protein
MSPSYAMFSARPGYLHPAGQATTPSATVSVQIPNVQVPAGVNAQGQVIDQGGNVITDSSGNPITLPAAPTSSAVATMPTAAPDASAAAPAARRGMGAALLSLAVSALVIGGASAVGAYYGAQRAIETPRKTRTSRRSA